jgi:hypothetical protein
VLGLGQSRTADLFAHAVPARSRLVDGHDPGHVQPSKTSGPGFPKTNLIRLARYTRPRCHRGFISSPRSALSNFRSPRRKIISAPRQCVGVLNDGHCTCQTRGGTTRRPPLHTPSAKFPGHANPADAFISPDPVAGPKRAAVVKGEIEFIGQVYGRTGIETNTSPKRVQIVDGAGPPRRRVLHNDLAGLNHLGSGWTRSINQHVGYLQIPPTMRDKSIQSR